MNKDSVNIAQTGHPDGTRPILIVPYMWIGDRQWGLAGQLRAGNYCTALVLPRTWKSALAPALAGIPERVGFVGEARFGLINSWRWGEKALPRFIDKNAALALPDGAPLPQAWPVPQLNVPAGETDRWRQANGPRGGSALPSAGRIIRMPRGF